MKDDHEIFSACITSDLVYLTDKTKIDEELMNHLEAAGMLGKNESDKILLGTNYERSTKFYTMLKQRGPRVLIFVINALNATKQFSISDTLITNMSQPNVDLGRYCQQKELTKEKGSTVVMQTNTDTGVTGTHKQDFIVDSKHIRPIAKIIQDGINFSQWDQVMNSLKIPKHVIESIKEESKTSLSSRVDKGITAWIDHTPRNNRQLSILTDALKDHDMIALEEKLTEGSKEFRK